VQLFDGASEFTDGGSDAGADVSAAKANYTIGILCDGFGDVVVVETGVFAIDENLSPGEYDFVDAVGVEGLDEFIECGNFWSGMAPTMRPVGTRPSGDIVSRTFLVPGRTLKSITDDICCSFRIPQFEELDVAV